MIKSVSIKLKPVNNSDYRFLYDLLKKRDPKANISHKKMPTYKQHVNFVKSKPYTKWYIIQYAKSKIGSIYLSKCDEIGIFLKKGIQGKHVGTTALNLLITKNPRTRYLANISPKNLKSIKFFKKNNFKLISYTYELETNYKT
jgi:RimJ/RimL family protein N-acetyltransferase